MRITHEEEENVHILDGNSDVWSVIREIADSGMQEEAFYVLDLGDLVLKHRLWMGLMPRVKPHYAVKCNDSLVVLEVLAALGAGFDCASKAEISKVLSLGVDTSRIIYANPAKPASHLRYASAVGVHTMTFDNESELYKIKKLYPDSRLVLRFRCDATEAQCQLGMKFGCDPITEAPSLLKTAKNLDLDVVGVSFHVGSGCKDPPVFRKAISIARDIFDVAAGLGMNLELLDLGGGYPGQKGSSINEIAEIINASLLEYFPDESAVQVIAEPGRFYVASAFTLACNIYSVRHVQRPGTPSGRHTMYYINDGVYGSFNCLLYDHQKVKALPLRDYAGSKLVPSSLWGPTCDGLDQVLEEEMLPEMQIGDWLVFENMGAYTLPVASPFNGFPVPKVHIVADATVWMLLQGLHFQKEHFKIGGSAPAADIHADLRLCEELSAWKVSIPTLEDRVIEYLEVEALN